MIGSGDWTGRLRRNRCFVQDVVVGWDGFETETLCLAADCVVPYGGPKRIQEDAHDWRESSYCSNRVDD